MNKSYKRDIQVLTKMMQNVKSAKDTIKRHNVSYNVNAANSLINDNEAFDLCSFYMAQFGEKVKLLTDTSRDELCKTVDLNVMQYFRNLIDHDYESVNKSVLLVYIQQLTSDAFLDVLRERLLFCQKHKSEEINETNAF